MAELIEKLGIDWRLILAQIVNFTILFFVLRKFVYGPVMDLLDKREKRVKEAENFAQNIDNKMAEIESDAKSKTDEAAKKADLIIHKAQERAKEREKEIISEASEKSQKIIEEAKWSAGQEKERVFQELKKEMGSLVVSAAQKIIEKDIKS
ncbi:F0F1 ATP synthase subunit B, partial [Candidatus Wolfebacteria bacterium]|nr:F0F1 ATP synthase subunit B [Candidatus Wolfebacteria bacterium]